MTLRSTGQWFWASGAGGGRGLPARRRDRTLVAMVVFASVVGCAVALTAYRALMSDADAYFASHRQITAQVLSIDDRSPAVSRRAGTRAEVAWVDGSGVRHTGTTRLRGDQVEEARVRIWIDAGGRPAPAPPGLAGFIVSPLLMGLFAAGVTCSVMLSAQSGRRMWIARRAMAGWDREWRARTDPER
ncbi:Rv1733c family protein [Streptosporangium canum]|uniref:Rv1733c family protein n=1 Tax=Streptosporangium canum TaxID=324952 RepID=UPI003F4E0089